MSAATVTAHGFFGKSLRDQRRAAIGWSIGLASVALMYALFYPSIKASAANLQAYMDKLPEAFKNVIGNDYTSAAGYLRGELFSSMGPILMLVFAIGAGARAIAGEEENRSLDVLLSTPLRRQTVLRDKAIAATGVTALLAAVLFAVVASIGPAFDLGIGLAELAAACVMLALLAVAFGSIALAVGASTGRRVLADAVAGGFAVFAVIVNAVAPSVHALGPLRPLSPFRWYLDPDPLLSGLHPVNMAVLAGIAVAGYVVARVAFGRRDLAA